MTPDFGQWTRRLQDLTQRVEKLEEKMEQIDRQSRCQPHTWQTSEDDPREWFCGRCGAKDLRKH